MSRCLGGAGETTLAVDFPIAARAEQVTNGPISSAIKVVQIWVRNASSPVPAKLFIVKFCFSL